MSIILFLPSSESLGVKKWPWKTKRIGLRSRKELKTVNPPKFRAPSFQGGGAQTRRASDFGSPLGTAFRDIIVEP